MQQGRSKILGPAADDSSNRSVPADAADEFYLRSIVLFKVLSLIQVDVLVMRKGLIMRKGKLSHLSAAILF